VGGERGGKTGTLSYVESKSTTGIGVGEEARGRIMRSVAQVSWGKGRKNALTKKDMFIESERKQKGGGGHRDKYAKPKTVIGLG